MLLKYFLFRKIAEKRTDFLENSFFLRTLENGLFHCPIFWILLTKISKNFGAIQVPNDVQKFEIFVWKNDPFGVIFNEEPKKRTSEA